MAGSLNIAVNTLPFWSRFVVPFNLVWDGTNNQNQVLTVGQKIRVFSYKQGEAAAQPLNGDLATARDTILQTGGQTRGGSLYDIRGLSFTKDGSPYEAVTAQSAAVPRTHAYWPGMSVQAANGVAPLVPSVEDQRSLEAMLLQAFLSTFAISLKVDGTKRILEMGPNQLYPGIGGNKDTIVSSNGDVFNSNYMPIREGIQWNPAGATDSNLIVELEAAYNVTMPAWVAPLDANPARNRTALGRVWNLAFICNFHGREEAPTSAVS